MSRRLLIDECVNRRWVLAPFMPLAACVFVKDLSPAAPDIDVIALARREHCLLLTEDGDFGRLIFGDCIEPPPGVILVTMQKLAPAQLLARVAAEATLALTEAPNALVLIDHERCRRRAFPGGARP